MTVRYSEAMKAISLAVANVVLEPAGGKQTFSQLGSSLEVLTHCSSNPMSFFRDAILASSSTIEFLAVVNAVVLYFFLN